MKSRDKKTPEVPAAGTFYNLFASQSADAPPAGELHSKVLLRQMAEAHFRESEDLSSEKLTGLSTEDIWTILHELRVHQIELEMQNEELRRAQAELDASRARYFDLYDLAPVGYVTVSEPGLIMEANLTAATMLGRLRPALVKQPISRIICKKDQDIFYKCLRQLLETGATQTCDLRIVREDGTEFFAHLKIIAARGKSGEPEYSVVLIDVTMLRQAEEEKDQLKGQLMQLQKMESVGRLAGGVAHDFNNMLGVILGHTELAIERTDPTDPMYPDLEEIRKAADRSADLTRQLLAFSRQQMIAPKELNLSETIAGMLKMLNCLIGEDIQLTFVPGKDLWSVRVDPSQIDQVLANLCVNARDAIADVGTITIETDNCTLDEEYCANQAGVEPGDYVRLSVSDTGCGMDKETMEHIFEPFFTTKKMGKGTGLGRAFLNK